MTIRILFVSALITLSSINAKVVHITSEQDYQRHYASDKPMVTMYSSKTCGPCDQMKPHFYAAAEATTDVTFAVVDTAAKGLGKVLSGIQSVPTLIFSHKGKRVKREVGGMSREQLNTSINTFRSTTYPSKKPVKVVRKRTITGPQSRPRKKPRVSAKKMPTSAKK